MTDQPPKSKSSKTPAPEGIHAAFVRAWSAIHTVAYDRSNEHFKAKYATYDTIIGAVRPLLAAEGLGFQQLPANAYDHEGHPDPRAILEQRLIHTSGEVMELGTIAVPVKKGGDPQAFGSAMTYAKRYGLCAAFGIPTGDDDDGNRAAAPDYRAMAMDMIAEWTGTSGQDLTAAARQIAQRSGTTDAKGIHDYVKQHMSQPFAEFMAPSTNGVSK